MTTRSEGQVMERSSSRGKVYALRFQAYGQRRYLTLGSPAEGWTRRRADEELQDVLADVRRAIWVPPGARGRWRPAAEAEKANCFGPFARALLLDRRGQVTPATIRYMEWGFAHLMPYFADWPLGEIDVRAVDAYRAHKVKESQARRQASEQGRPMRDEEGRALRALSASSINKTIDNLQWVLAIALEQGRIETNPAVGRRRRLKRSGRPTEHLDSSTQIEALLEAAIQLDRDRRCLIDDRHPIIVTLVFAGLRAHELSGLRWRDVDLDNARINVRRSKTPAGLREISLLPVLADVLRRYRAASAPVRSEDLVFPTRSGTERGKDNLRNRVLRPALVRADQLLEANEQPPLPAGLTTHGLRHTYASILIALGKDPVSVMAQLGHTDPAFSLRVYTHMMCRDPSELKRLRALVAGQVCRGKGSRPGRRSLASALGQSLRKLRLSMAARATRLD